MWRMALWGLLLCVAAMVVFSIALQIGAVLMDRGWGPVYAVFSTVAAGAAGAVMGLLLGLLCGAVLFGMTRILLAAPGGIWQIRSNDGSGVRPWKHPRLDGGLDDPWPARPAHV